MWARLAFGLEVREYARARSCIVVRWMNRSDWQLAFRCWHAREHSEENYRKNKAIIMIMTKQTIRFSLASIFAAGGSLWLRAVWALRAPWQRIVVVCEQQTCENCRAVRLCYGIFYCGKDNNLQLAFKWSAIVRGCAMNFPTKMCVDKIDSGIRPAVIALRSHRRRFWSRFATMSQCEPFYQYIWLTAWRKLKATRWSMDGICY